MVDGEDEIGGVRVRAEPCRVGNVVAAETRGFGVRRRGGGVEGQAGGLGLGAVVVDG